MKKLEQEQTSKIDNIHLLPYSFAIFVLASALFRLEYPDSETHMFSSLFNGPPRLFSAKLYVHDSIENFTISVSSTKPDIAVVVVSIVTTLQHGVQKVSRGYSFSHFVLFEFITI